MRGKWLQLGYMVCKMVKPLWKTLWHFLKVTHTHTEKGTNINTCDIVLSERSQAKNKSTSSRNPFM